MFTLDYVGINYKNGKKHSINMPEGDQHYWLLFFLSEVYLELDGDEQLYESGTAILYAPAYPQRYFHPFLGFSNDWVKFSGEDMGSFLEEINFPLNIPFQVENSEDVHDRVRRIEQEFFMKDKNSVYMLDALMRELLLYLSRLYNQKLGGARDFHVKEQQFRQVRSIIMSHLDQPWTIDDMANLLGLSPSRFSHIYTSIFHVSPKQNLLSERMNQAKFLLRSQDYSVGEVASKVGYDNIYHFSKQFKKATGMSPSEYRKRGTVT